MHFITLATRNAHKTREFTQILGPGVVVRDLSGMTDVPEVEETGSTFAENAVLKAAAASRLIPGWVVSDDSGLSVAALKGEPGVRSARYAGEHATDRENIAKLLLNLQGNGDRKAAFHCAIALAKEGRVVEVFHGAVAGSILLEPRGELGFGYDPVFVPDGYAQTFAELGDTVKNAISHRASAIAQLREYLSER